jgi:hypothetical protein
MEILQIHIVFPFTYLLFTVVAPYIDPFMHWMAA